MRRRRHWLIAWMVDVFAAVGFIMTAGIVVISLLIASHLAEERRAEKDTERHLAELMKEPAPIRRGYIDAVIGCKEPCVVAGNNGGNLLSFRKAADEVLAGRRRNILISGLCASACAYFADLVREKACITETAVFGFHQATFTHDTRVRTIPVHSPDIQKWVMENGGFPPPERMKYMPYAEAKKFWRTCS